MFNYAFGSLIRPLTVQMRKVLETRMQVTLLETLSPGGCESRHGTSCQCSVQCGVVYMCVFAIVHVYSAGFHIDAGGGGHWDLPPPPPKVMMS